jgi:hypothetical protein
MRWETEPELFRWSQSNRKGEEESEPKLWNHEAALIAIADFENGERDCEPRNAGRP